MADVANFKSSRNRKKRPADSKWGMKTTSLSTTSASTARLDEDILRAFDLNQHFGPCLGLSRLDRYRRAQVMTEKFGATPPPTEIEQLLQKPNAQQECLWAYLDMHAMKQK